MFSYSFHLYLHHQSLGFLPIRSATYHQKGALVSNHYLEFEAFSEKKAFFRLLVLLIKS